MSHKSRPRYVEVWLHGQLVGWLCEADRVVRFVGIEGFLVNRQRATLSLSFSVPGAEGLTQRILGNRYNPASYRERGELPPFFAGLLAEGSLRRRLAATRRNPNDMDDLGVLVAAGEDLPGAVVMRPADLATLTAAARAHGTPGGAEDGDIEMSEAAIVGAASLAGMQDKIALIALADGNSYGVSHGGQLTDVIAKLPLGDDDSQIMNEYACMQLAALAGVDVACCRPVLMSRLWGHPQLVEMAGRETCFLAVDRFDRGPNGAPHVEDACQLLTLMPSQKYAGDEQFVVLLALLNR